MKATKIVMAVAAALGLLAVFALPYISVEGFSLKFWDFRKMPSGLTQGLLNGPKQVYVALVGFGAVLAVAAHAVATKRLARWAGIVGIVGSLLAFATEGVRKGLASTDGVGTAIGGKLLFLAAAVGLIASILGTIKPDQTKV